VQKILSGCLALTLVAMLAGCGENGGEANVSLSHKKISVTESVWGTSPDGKEVKAFTLTNMNGMKAVIIEFGGILHELHVPDKDGNLADVVLGCNSIEDYDTVSPYFSALTGRYANRIRSPLTTIPIVSTAAFMVFTGRCGKEPPSTPTIWFRWPLLTPVPTAKRVFPAH